mgnify:CR=1 FL=1
MKSHYDKLENVRDEAALNLLTDRIMDACCTVQRTMGPGLSEAIYQACLMKELELQNIAYGAQVHIPIEYKGHVLKNHLVLDLLVENQVIIEVKSVSEFIPIHEAQLLTYLRVTGRRVGYLVNFNVTLMKNGIRRMRNG